MQYHPTHALGFVTGMTCTPYPLFLCPANRLLPPTPSTISEYRIRCSCFCPPPNSHLLFFMDVQNVVFRVDMWTRRLQQVADISMLRGALKPTEEHAVLAGTAYGQARVFWRQGSGLWMLDVREGRSGVKRNLSTVWQDVVGR